MTSHLITGPSIHTATRPPSSCPVLSAHASASPSPPPPPTHPTTAYDRPTHSSVRPVFLLLPSLHHSLILSTSRFIIPPTKPPTHPPTHLSYHPLRHSLIRPSLRSPSPLPTHPHIHPPPPLPPTHPSTHSPTHPPTPTHSPTNVAYLCQHPLTPSSLTSTHSQPPPPPSTTHPTTPSPHPLPHPQTLLTCANSRGLHQHSHLPIQPSSFPPIRHPPTPQPLLLTHKRCLRVLTAADSISTHIVNGQESSRGRKPYIISLQRGGGHICGAVLISPSYVITAAHCVDAA